MIRNRQRCSLSILLYNITLDVLSNSVREEKERFTNQEELKLSLISYDMIFYRENSQEATTTTKNPGTNKQLWQH